MISPSSALGDKMELWDQETLWLKANDLPLPPGFLINYSKQPSMALWTVLSASEACLHLWSSSHSSTLSLKVKCYLENSQTILTRIHPTVIKTAWKSLLILLSHI